MIGGAAELVCGPIAQHELLQGVPFQAREPGHVGLRKPVIHVGRLLLFFKLFSGIHASFLAARKIGKGLIDIHPIAGRISATDR